MGSGRLHENFKVTNRMEPYANRLRLRLGHFDVSDPKKKRWLTAARNEMTRILGKKKIRQNKAQQVVAQTLDVAADHQLEVLRREHNFGDLRRS
jgi:hypothetical protein